MIAIVVGRASRLSEAQKLAERFERRYPGAAAHGVAYRVETILRSDFDRRPFAVVMVYDASAEGAAELPLALAMRFASLETYRMLAGRYVRPALRRRS